MTHAMMMARRSLAAAAARCVRACVRFQRAGVNLDVGKTHAKRLATWDANDRAEAEVDNAGLAYQKAAARVEKLRGRK